MSIFEIRHALVIRGFTAAAVLAAGAVGTFTACGAGDRAAPEPVVRDSAGITIVENPEIGAWGEDEAWRLSSEPVVQIGVLEGAPEYQLFRAMDAVRLSDGRIVVANRGTHELRFYDAGGTHLESVGREGGGPGEYQSLSAVERLAGDTIVAWDWDAGRLSVLAPSGEFVRTLTPTAGMEGFRPRLRGIFADGSFVVRPEFNPARMASGGDGPRRDTVAFPRYGYADAAFRDTITVLPGPERFMETMDGGGFAIRDIPFGRVPFFAVQGELAYLAESGRYEVAVRGPDGELLRLIRRAAEPVPVTDEDVERYTENWVEQQLDAQSTDDPGARREAEQQVAAMPIPETFPALGGLNVDVDGRLWVGEYERPDADGPRRWDVYDPGGHLLGTVETPRDLEIFEIGRDYVLGRATDELEIEYIRLYELIKPTEP